MNAIARSAVGDVALLTLDRPGSLNAINGQTVRELNEALDVIESDESVALVLTGAGRAFCAGGDLKEEVDERRGRVQAMHDLVLRLTRFPKISVAALNGLAFGGGLELAMACTFRVAVPTAMFALPEAKALQALPGFGGTQLLPRLVGRARALEMILTGDAIPAETALSMGLLNAVADDCVEAAVDLARRASVAGPLAINLIRRVVDDGLAVDLATGLTLEARAARQVSGSDATRAAVAAFSESGSASLKK